MKKFDDLMRVSKEIKNISAADAKEKINDATNIPHKVYTRSWPS